MKPITSVKELVSMVGFDNTILLLSFIIIIGMAGGFMAFALSIRSLTKAVTLLTEKVSSPYMDVHNSVMIFRSIMSEHISLNLSYIGEVLEHNNLIEREDQIKKNIEREFHRVTKEETEKLSQIKSVCGDMGLTVNENLDWKKFLSRVYEIVFLHNTPIKLKIHDIKLYMGDIVSEMVKIIEKNGAYNR